MAARDASELARQLAQHAEAVCRRYLSNGRRRGGYWLVGDVRNRPGRSLFVRLVGPESGHGASGRWTDAATGQHGDLLDLIREACGLADFRDVADEARLFLGVAQRSSPKPGKAPPGSPDAARRLFAMATPIAGTLAETYLHHRGITNLRDTEGLRFHPRCYYRSDDDAAPASWPAIVAAVTALDGQITGVHRTYLARDGRSKAPIATPRRAMGDLLGHAVRFGIPRQVMAAGEGIETILSVRQTLPRMPMVAALSAAHLAAIRFPPDLQRLYIIRDNDPAGEQAQTRLADRAMAAGIETITLIPRGGDFNGDLHRYGTARLRAAIRGQLAAADVGAF